MQSNTQNQKFKPNSSKYNTPKLKNKQRKTNINKPKRQNHRRGPRGLFPGINLV